MVLLENDEIGNGYAPGRPRPCEVHVLKYKPADVRSSTFYFFIALFCKPIGIILRNVTVLLSIHGSGVFEGIRKLSDQ
jgi:hypothetical protein